MNAPPAFQFYPDDFIGGTVDLTAEDCGAYIRLLCYQWGRGSIPDKKSAVDRVAGCEVSAEVMNKFPNNQNPRLERVRSDLIAYRESCVENGKRGGNPAFANGKRNPYYQKDNPPLSFEDKGGHKGADNPKINTPPPVSVSISPSVLQTPHSNSTGASVNGDSKMGAAKSALGKAFKRPDSDAWEYSEECLLLEVRRRPAFTSELDELLVFKSRAGRFFPQSILKLLCDWVPTLDRARNQEEGTTSKSLTLMDKEALRQLEEAKRL